MDARQIRDITAQVEKFVDCKIEAAIDNIAVEMTGKINGYDGAFCADETTKEVLELHDKYVQALTAMLMADCKEATNESLDDEYETDYRYYVYDNKGNVVSDGFEFEDDAIEFATENEFPVIKVHNYFVDESGKLRPDGEPEVIWNA